MEMKRRGIEEPLVRSIFESYEQEQPVRYGRKVFQSRVTAGEPPKNYLIRVFVDVDRDPPEVVTVYKTSKIKKYWRVTR
jgi:hypothetical protein